jgi:hypothetical protein
MCSPCGSSPRTNFGPYVTVWHRDPGGAWSIYVDGVPVGAACPRYFGPGLTTAASSSTAGRSVYRLFPRAQPAVRQRLVASERSTPNETENQGGRRR